MDNKQEKSHFSYSDLFQEAGSCSHDEELFLYFQQLLPTEKKPQFEQHLNECSICSASHQDLQEMEASTEIDRDPVKDDLFFRLERSRLRRSFQTEYVKGESLAPWFIRTFSFPPAIGAAMISLILLLSYPAYRFFFRQNGLSLKPELTSTVILPVKLQRSAQMDTIDLTFNKDQQSTNIVLSLPLVDYSGFVVEISKGGKMAWQEEVHPKDSRISLILHRNYFESGAYELTVFGLSDKDKILLSRFTLNVHLH
jgi:hypothetical protein